MQRRSGTREKWNEFIKNEDWNGISDMIIKDDAAIRQYIFNNADTIGDPLIFAAEGMVSDDYDVALANGIILLFNKLIELEKKPDAYHIINEIMSSNFQFGMNLLDKNEEFCSSIKDPLKIRGMTIISSELITYYRNNKIQKAIQHILLTLEPDNPERICKYLGTAADNLFAAYRESTPEAFVTKIFKYLDKNEQGLWDKAFQGHCWNLIEYILDLNISETIVPKTAIPGIASFIKENIIHITDNDIFEWSPLNFIAYENRLNANWFKNENLVRVVRKLLNLPKENEENDQRGLQQMIFTNSTGAYKVFIGHLPDRFLQVEVTIPAAIRRENNIFFGNLSGGDMTDFMEIYGNRDFPTFENFKIVPVDANQKYGHKELTFSIRK